ncbi:hypothetical protein [Microvirga sp. M2]|uniref:hypothetical protein n=1 Tax=Microvirga sp. M2 TaxID=3073270 RepID=UPI0039C141C4
MKSRTQAMVTLKTIVTDAPTALRESLEGLTGTMALIRHLAALRPGAMTDPTASAKAALRALARRWLMLDAEIKSHDAALDTLTAEGKGKLQIIRCLKRFVAREIFGYLCRTSRLPTALSPAS